MALITTQELKIFWHAGNSFWAPKVSVPNTVIIWVLSADFDTNITVSDFQSNSTASKATVAIDNVDKTVFYSDRVELYGTVKASSTGLTSIATNGDLQLSANGTGEVFVNDILRITESTDPTTPTASVKLYAKTPSGGETGIFFKNKNGTTDELISRKRAMLYSLMF